MGFPESFDPMDTITNIDPRTLQALPASMAAVFEPNELVRVWFFRCTIRTTPHFRAYTGVEALLRDKYQRFVVTKLELVDFACDVFLDAIFRIQLLPWSEEDLTHQDQHSTSALWCNFESARVKTWTHGGDH